MNNQDKNCKPTFQHNFWKSYNSSRCKTVMMVISVLITCAFAIDQLFGTGSPDLAKGFFAIIGYWIGRTSKSKDK